MPKYTAVATFDIEADDIDEAESIISDVQDSIHEQFGLITLENYTVTEG
jgi:hypothetical protein